MEDYINENEIKDENIQKEDEYNLALDYYSKDNPFQNILIASGFGLVGSYSTTVIATSLSSAIIIGGHAFLTDTAFLVATGAKAITGIGLVIAIPCLIGGISYQIYKFFKFKKLKEYIEKLSDINDNSMKEEREIYMKIFNEFRNYFQLKLLEKYTTIKKEIIEYSNKIILKINQIRKIFKEQEMQEDINLIKNKINDNIFNLNILIIGTTGVGKSTLINEFLKLKNNRAEEGKGCKPMKIDLWPKKYPINNDDSTIKNIFLYDTEGIEKSNNKGNDINSHFLKIKNFITEHGNINAIWYCISSNRLDGDEDYIKNLLDLYKSIIKIPIIFIYTKAYSNKEDDIESMQEGLKDIEYYKNNSKEFHFKEVISKDYANKKGIVKEKSKGLEELLNLTLSLSEKSFKCPIYQIISKFYNKKAEEIIKNLSKILQEQFNNIILKQEKFENFKKYINDIFNCSYGDYLKSKNENNSVLKTEDSNQSNNIITPYCSKDDKNKDEIDITYKSVDEILKLVEPIKNDDLAKAIKTFKRKEDLSNKVEDFIKAKYEEKKCQTQKLEDFNEDIEDYIITTFDSSKDIYGLYFLYDMLRDTILHEIIVNLNEDFKERKMETTKKLDLIISEKIKDFNQKFNKNNI